MTEQRYIFFSEPELAQAAIDLARQRNAQIITPTVAGDTALARRNVKAIRADEIADISPERLNRMGCENMDRVWTLLAIMDKYLEDEFADLRGMNPGVASGAMYQVKLFFDTLMAQWLFLGAWAERIEGSIIVLENYKTAMSASDEFYLPDRTLYPDIARFLLPADLRAKVGVTQVVVPARKQMNCRLVIKSMIGRKLRKVQKYLSLKKFDKKKALILHYGHDLPYLSAVVPDLGIDLLLGDSDVGSLLMAQNGSAATSGVRDRVKKVFDGLATDEEYLNCLHAEGLDFSGYLHRKLERYFCDLLPSFIAGLPAIEGFLRSKRFDLVLSNSLRIDLGQSLLLGCSRRLGLPVVVYQEGGGTGYLDWPLFETDFRHADYFLSYGAGVESSEFVGKSNARIVPVGSCRLFALREKLQHAKKPRASADGVPVIYFVPDIIHDMCNHYPYNGGTSYRSFNHQTKIIELMSKIKEVRWVVKTIPALHACYETFLSKKGISGIHVEVEKLSDIFGKADGFIIDYPSTVLQECLVANRPMALFYQPVDCRIQDGALDLLKKRIYVSSDVSEYAQILDNLANDYRQGSLMVENVEFLEQYCVQSDSLFKVKTFFDSLSTAKQHR